MKPKLFQYKIDYKKAAKYEYSSVEVNQEYLIHADYDMGMPLDLIDRDIYYLEPNSSAALSSLSGAIQPRDVAHLKTQLEALRLTLLDEKDKFVLSDRNTFETQIKK